MCMKWQLCLYSEAMHMSIAGVDWVIVPRASRQNF